MAAALPVSPNSPHSDPPVARLPLTVVIPTLNEAAQIGDAIGDLRWVDEVIVIDGGSRDDTVGIAERAGARVLTVTGQTIAGQRNAGIETSRNRWIFALDADERISPALRDELKGVLAQPRHQAYGMSFENYYLGRRLRHGPWGRDWHIRLFTNERRFVTHRVHEHLEHVDDVGRLSGTVLHRSYRDLSHHLSKIVQYSRWGAEDMQARGRRATLGTMATRPAWRFFRDYVLYSGWRDGTPGFIAAVMSAYASFLKYAFLYSRQREA